MQDVLPQRFRPQRGLHGDVPSSEHRFDIVDVAYRERLYGLPLDVHPEVGNNVQLARAIGLAVEGSFAQQPSFDAGVWGVLEVTRETLAARLDDVLGVRVRLLPGGGEKLKRVGVITGGAGSMIQHAVAAGLDAFITGEGAHHTYFDAMESGINVYYGGHYATETFGVRALAQHLEERVGIPWEFNDLPTGL